MAKLSKIIEILNKMDGDEDVLIDWWTRGDLEEELGFKLTDDGWGIILRRLSIDTDEVRYLMEGCNVEFNAGKIEP